MKQEKVELEFERVFEVVTARIADGQSISWTVVAPNQKATRAAFRYLLANNRDLKIVAVKRSDTAIISGETVARIRNGAPAYVA